MSEVQIMSEDLAEELKQISKQTSLEKPAQKSSLSSPKPIQNQLLVPKKQESFNSKIQNLRQLHVILPLYSQKETNEITRKRMPKKIQKESEEVDQEINLVKDRQKEIPENEQKGEMLITGVYKNVLQRPRTRGVGVTNQIFKTPIFPEQMRQSYVSSGRHLKEKLRSNVSQCVADLEDVLNQEKGFTTSNNQIQSNLNFEIRVDEDENITVDHSLRNSRSHSKQLRVPKGKESQIMSKTANFDPNEVQRWSMANADTLNSNRDLSADGMMSGNKPESSFMGQGLKPDDYTSNGITSDANLPSWSLSKARLDTRKFSNLVPRRVTKVFNNDYNFRNQTYRPTFKKVDLELEQINETDDSICPQTARKEILPTFGLFHLVEDTMLNTGFEQNQQKTQEKAQNSHFFKSRFAKQGLITRHQVKRSKVSKRSSQQNLTSPQYSTISEVSRTLQGTVGINSSGPSTQGGYTFIGDQLYKNKVFDMNYNNSQPSHFNHSMPKIQTEMVQQSIQHTNNSISQASQRSIQKSKNIDIPECKWTSLVSQSQPNMNEHETSPLITKQMELKGSNPMTTRGLVSSGFRSSGSNQGRGSAERRSSAHSSQISQFLKFKGK